jgi:hypothetical protein
MDVHRAARSTVAIERTCHMADLRKCIGSTRFGIEAHEAPVADFPVQPSQKDGLGRMCKVHWNQYTAGLARDAKARKAAEADSVGCPFGGTTPDECSTIRERSVAGISDDVPDCPIHDVYREPEPIQARSRASRRKAGAPTADAAQESAG